MANYIVLEYTPQHEGNVENIPWHEILDGAVTVTNFKHITKESLTEFTNNLAFNNVTSDHDHDTINDGLEHLQELALQTMEIDPSITPWEPYEDLNAVDLLYELENIAENLYYGFYQYLQLKNIP